MLKIFCFFFLYFIKDVSMQQSCEADNKYNWSYHGPDNGPSHWADLYPDCNGADQSPVSIKDENTFDGLPELQFKGFDVPITKAKVQNLGWTVTIFPEDDVTRSMKFGFAVYDLVNIHFHFGSESDPGAEHILNGVKYPMEIHYYMYTYKHSTPGVLSTVIDVQDDDNSVFDPIIDVLTNVQYKGDVAELETNLNLNELLPEMSREYYYYYFYIGSNSIPPCDPDYSWWILKDIGKIGNKQLDTFMTLYSVEEGDASDECLMGPNYRPVQSLEDFVTYTGPWFFPEK